MAIPVVANTAVQVFKDPSATLDYIFDWSVWAGADAIVSSTWSVPPGLTKISEELSGGLSTVWIYGGAAGEVYKVTNTVTTALGRTESENLYVRMISISTRPLNVGENTSSFGYLLNEQEGQYSYQLGDKIDLIFKPDEATLDTIGETVQVEILDIFGTVIDTVVAIKLGDILVAEYTIPLNLNGKYNPYTLDESGYSYELFYLVDRWNLPGNFYADFMFTVPRKLEPAITDNSIIQLELSAIQDSSSNTIKDSISIFTTKLAPFYSTVTDVRDVNRQLLKGYNDFSIARQIVNFSKIVDRHMKPDIIYHQEAYDHAVSNFVRLKVAWHLLLSVAQNNLEEKQLDTFRLKASTSGPKDLLNPIEEQANKFALFIYAGGKDTPFVSKTFEKGLYDPNRPNLSRSRIDNSGWYPWINTSTNSFTMNIDGNDVEVRGQRGIAYHYLMSKFKNIDSGDAGYLAGI